uniref:Chlorophyllase-2, chloroplastic n=1 Tax=Aegilops tauschii TaxID=37682 RepID=M8BAW6_AEGTA
MASAGNVFDHGRHGTSLAKVEQATRCCATSPVDAQSPPKPLLVAAPCDAGEYPVVLFLHGYLCNNYFYSQLLHHVASHGFIVIAPQTPPPILAYKPNALRVPAPVMVIGTGLGELPRNALFPPCAPLGVSHAEFYDECAAPACHLVARDYGHTDMMDDVTTGAKGLATRALCKSGGARAPMRRFVAGAMVAFLKKWVQGKPEWLDAIREQTVVAPVVLSVVEFRDE